MTDADDTTGARKAALRGRMLAERAALAGAVRADASARIVRHLASLPGLRRADPILAYAAVGSEVDLDGFLATVLAEGRVLCLPWVDGPELGVARVRDLVEDVAPGWRGVPEPRERQARAVEPAALQAVVAPGLAFDRRGQRLGYGGGHFDRLLARTRPGTVVVGVAFDLQLVDDVPAEAHDAAVDVVVTESGIMWPGA